MVGEVIFTLMLIVAAVVVAAVVDWTDEPHEPTDPPGLW